MENTETINKNDQWSNDPNVSNLNDARNEVSSSLIYGNVLKPSILGSSYRVPDIPTKYIEPAVLDTSLPYIPVYAHLKIYDLKPVKRIPTPPLLSELRLKYEQINSEKGDETESCKSSKASPSTGRTNRGRSFVTLRSQESERNLKVE
ncbi:hypothetical protein ANTRET_LOCUS3568 [Anthophora retusa]